ncbi:hypothetical protein VPHF99_0147 [Vibrio phage F99]
MAKKKDTQTQFDLTKYIIEVSAKEYGLSKVDKLVLICLSNYMQKDKYGIFSAFPSQSTLADITGMNRNTVGSSLNKMEKLGYLNAETRHDNSKVYTWLGFEANKTLKAQNFMRVCQDKAERKKELDKVRGEILGRNQAEIRKLKKFAQTLLDNGHDEDCEFQYEKIKVIKLAIKENVYFKEYQPYKELTRVVVTKKVSLCDDCGDVLEDGNCYNPDCELIPF